MESAAGAAEERHGEVGGGVAQADQQEAAGLERIRISAVRDRFAGLEEKAPGRMNPMAACSCHAVMLWRPGEQKRVSA